MINGHTKIPKNNWPLVTQKPPTWQPHALEWLWLCPHQTLTIPPMGPDLRSYEVSIWSPPYTNWAVAREGRSYMPYIPFPCILPHEKGRDKRSNHAVLSDILSNNCLPIGKYDLKLMRPHPFCPVTGRSGKLCPVISMSITFFGPPIEVSRGVHTVCPPPVFPRTYNWSRPAN